MKHFLHKKWLSIPVIVVLVLALTAGGVLAAGYGFFTATLSAEVVEAVAVGAGTWDNLEPYGSVDDVDVVFGADTLTITTIGSGNVTGSGFAPGEWIVIPLNIRNGSDGALALTASTGGQVNKLILEASYETNVGAKTDDIPAGHEGDFLAYDFKALGVFNLLDNWSTTVEGNSGFSGSAVHNAQVLFVKITAPGDIVPGTYTVTLTLERQ